jgi:predicted ATP-grasp superfamily ATP-dependent carboligase
VTSPESPPCIVLGLETQIGLSVVRELGMAGIRVIGIGQSRRSIGLHSRFMWKGLVAAPRSAALLEMLQALGAQHPGSPLLAISEINLLWLEQQRQQLRGLVPMLPDHQALATVLDKQATLQAAAAVGVQTPRTWQPASQQDIDAVAPTWPLPAVLKWSDPNAVVERLSRLGMDLVKAEYVQTPQELTAALRRYEPAGVWPLVQAYCPGYGLGQFFYCVDGEVVRSFQHRRVAEWPPEGGFSSVCDAVPLSEHKDLQLQSAALLRHIGWQGVAMVEYRYDPASRTARLMEINGRFWGSFPLALHCGAGFALLAYRHAIASAAPHLPDPRDDLRCRMVATELKRLRRILLQPGRIQDPMFQRRPWLELVRFIGDFLRPRVRYYVWMARDPMPWLVDVLNLLRRG